MSRFTVLQSSKPGFGWGEGHNILFWVGGVGKPCVIWKCITNTKNAYLETKNDFIFVIQAN